jgi:ADP-heptose:LPS heptosyltransferase
LNFNPQNILIIHFGQIGDIILSLPALRVVREKFPRAKITALIGKSGADILEISGFVDEKIIVDRVRLRDSAKIWSTKQVFKLLRSVRARKFDFIIDLHSLYETNLLGFFSGAKHRLYANRANRSLDFLANFKPKPPRLNRELHLTDYYLNVLKPLGAENSKRFVQIRPLQNYLEKIEKFLATKNVKNTKLIGLFPGAGHKSRCWSLDNFSRLGKLLSRDKSLKTIVFLGPEEEHLRQEIEETFSPEVLILDKLSLLEFAAALSFLEILVSNDTGAAHIGAVVGTKIVLVMDKRAPLNYLPLTENLRVVNSRTLDGIRVEEVFEAAQSFLRNEKLSLNEISNR